GFLSCRATVVAAPTGLAPDCGGGIGSDVDRFDLPVSPQVRGFVVELFWRAGSKASEALRLVAEDAATSERLSSAAVANPVRLRLDDDATAARFSDGGQLRVRVEPAPALPSADADAGAAFQQEF